MKGLEALEALRKNKLIVLGYSESLSIIEKELKALKIIENKGVFVHLLQQSRNVEEYNSLMLITFKKKAEKDYKGAVEKFCLTQEEYDLLKEVLANEEKS